MNIKHGHVTTDEEIRAWAAVVRHITRASCLKHWQLECMFKVGSADGRVWRSWLAGVGKDGKRKKSARCPHRDTREKVTTRAREMGWLELHSHVVKTVQGTLPELDDFLQPIDFPLPNIPYLATPNCANLAAAHLLKNADGGLDRWDERRLKSMKRFEEQAEVKTWLDAIKQVKNLRKTIPDQIIKAMLVAAYKKTGYR